MENDDEEVTQKDIEELVSAIEAIRKHANNKRGVTSCMDCPKCKTGLLNYSISSLNGHVHARCRTVNCLAFMM